MRGEEVREQAERLESLLPRAGRMLNPAGVGSFLAHLSIVQLRVCGILREGPRPMSRISDELQISRSAASQIAARLERLGLVERVFGPGDRRLRLLQLTAYGRSLLAARHAARVERAFECLQRLGPAERAVLIDSLERLVDDCAPTGAPQAAND